MLIVPLAKIAHYNKMDQSVLKKVNHETKLKAPNINPNPQGLQFWSVHPSTSTPNFPTW